jgi:hypothetical protein
MQARFSGRDSDAAMRTPQPHAPQQQHQQRLLLRHVDADADLSGDSFGDFL